MCNSSRTPTAFRIRAVPAKFITKILAFARVRTAECVSACVHARAPRNCCVQAVRISPPSVGTESPPRLGPERFTVSGSTAGTTLPEQTLTRYNGASGYGGGRIHSYLSHILRTHSTGYNSSTC